MPELPEVETTLRGIQPYIKNQKIKSLVIRQATLRWPISPDLKQILKNQVIKQITRRGKYLLLTASRGTLLLHLGMSGSLRILKEPTPAKKHDHFDLELSNHTVLRFTDPRRFGACLWTEDDPKQHPLLKNLGPEPLSHDFTGAYLKQRAHKRNIPIKTFIMDSHVVTGIGNIYATESLFVAGILPTLPLKKINLERYNSLCAAIKKILRLAIKQGGTTLKDFQKSDGTPGYFKMHLKVYGREGLPCLQCHTHLKEIRLAQRSTVYCPHCQK